MPLLTSGTRPPSNYPVWQYATAEGVVVVPDWVKLVARMYGGDHWLDAQGWMGPHPAPTDPGAQEAWQEIARAFTGENIIKEVVDRRMGGVIGREPMWSLVPRQPTDPNTGEASTADQSLIDEATDALTEWWDTRGIHETLQMWTATLLTGERSVLRMHIPPGFVQEGTIAGTASPVRFLSATNPADALRQLYLDALDPGCATLYEHPDTRRPAGVYLYTVGDAKRAELSYIDPATQRTLVRQLGGPMTAPPTALSLGGRLPIFEARDRRWITDQMLQIQRALNLALTMVPHNIVAGGFLEMIVTNGQMPGELREVDGRKVWVPTPMQRGASMTQFIDGQDIGYDAQGKPMVTTPNVQFRPISPVTPLVEASSALYERMLNAANQIHVLMNSDGAASGRSRDIARAEFGGTLRAPRARAQRAGRWIIESALAWMELLTGQPGRYTSRLRCNFQCMLDLGPVAVEERAQNALDVKEGIMSTETAMERAGIEDVDAEQARIDESPRGQLGLSTEQAAAVLAWMDNGLTFLGACEAAHIDPKLATKLDGMIDDTPPPVPIVNNGGRPGVIPPVPAAQ